jgi:hypothetical protein
LITKEANILPQDTAVFAIARQYQDGHYWSEEIAKEEVSIEWLKSYRGAYPDTTGFENVKTGNSIVVRFNEWYIEENKGQWKRPCSVEEAYRYLLSV